METFAGSVSNLVPIRSRFSMENVVFILLSGYCGLTALAVMLGPFYRLGLYERDTRIVKILNSREPPSVESIRETLKEQGTSWSVPPRLDLPSMYVIQFRKPPGHTLLLELDRGSSRINSRYLKGRFSNVLDLERALDNVDYTLLWLRSGITAAVCLLPPILWGIRSRSSVRRVRLMLEIVTGLAVIAVLHISTSLPLHQSLYP